VNSRSVVIAFAALLLLVVALFPVMFQRVEEDVEFGPSGQAAFNEYYALQRMVEELGVPASSRYGVGKPPPSGWTVVLCPSDAATRDRLWWQILPWVDDEGGHVVVVPPDLDRVTGVGGQDADTGAPTVITDTIYDFFEIGVQSGRRGQSLHRPGGGAWILGEHATIGLTYDGPRLAEWATQTATWAVRVPFGRGAATVLSDATPFDNEHLGDADHAPLAWELLERDGRPPDGVLFVLTGATDSLLALIWKHARPLLLSCLVVVLLLAWRGAVRTAPVLPAQPRPRRALMEHVGASGRYLWRLGLKDALLSPARVAVRRRLGLHRGGTIDDDALVPVAAERLAADRGASAASEHDARRARDALIGPVPTSPAAFRAVIFTLQQLWSPR